MARYTPHHYRSKPPWDLGTKIKITQTVELVRGEQSQLLDTCRVRYRIDNIADADGRKVGIRFLLDSFIGTNDDVPFTIPGDSALCDTDRDLEGPGRPDRST
jgi:hypothetical protein